MRLRQFLAGVLCTFALSLGACSSVSSMVSSISAAASSGTATSNAVYYAAEAYSIAAKVTTSVVESGVLTSAQLTKLQTLRASCRTALESMQTALEAGDTVDMATFSTAWTAFKTYLATLGVTISRADTSRIHTVDAAFKIYGRA